MIWVTFTRNFDVLLIAVYSLYIVYSGFSPYAVEFCSSLLGKGSTTLVNVLDMGHANSMCSDPVIL